MMYYTIASESSGWRVQLYGTKKLYLRDVPQLFPTRQAAEEYLRVKHPRAKPYMNFRPEPGIQTPDPYAVKTELVITYGRKTPEAKLGVPVSTSGAVRRFLEDIRNTCVKHGLVLTVSDYDALQVWPISDDTVARLMDAEDRTQK